MKLIERNNSWSCVKGIDKHFQGFRGFKCLIQENEKHLDFINDLINSGGIDGNKKEKDNKKEENCKEKGSKKEKSCKKEKGNKKEKSSKKEN